MDPVGPEPLPPPPTDGGQPLAPALGSVLSDYFGHDLGAVRVHTDPQARSFLGQAGARAAAWGDHIYLSQPLAGSFPSSNLARLIGHEAAHVAQFREGRAGGPGFSGAPGSLADALEREASGHETRIGTRLGTLGAVKQLRLLWEGVAPDDRRLVEVERRVRARLEELLPTLVPGRFAVIPTLDVAVRVNLSRGAPVVAEEVAQQVAREAERVALGGAATGTAKGGGALQLSQDAGTTRPCRLRIEASPATDPLVLGQSVTFQIAHDPIMTAAGSRYPRISRAWQARSPDGRLRRGGYRYAFELALDQPGRWSVSVAVEWSKGEVYTLELTPTVRSLEQVAEERIRQAVPQGYLVFRGQLELHHLRLAGGGIPEQRFGAAWISCAGPNPAAPRWNLVHTYTVHPPAGASRFEWYCQPASWERMPSENYHGARRTTLGDQPAYALGTGRTANLALSSANIFTIVCRCLDAQGKLVGLAHYVQAALDEERLRQVEGWRKYMGQVDEALRLVQEGSELPVKAVYVNKETGATMEVALFLGRDAKDPRRVRLLDLTPGVSRISYEGASLEAALRDFDDGNSYPEGSILLEVPANQGGVGPTRRVIATDGASLWATWSSRAGWASLGLAGLGVLATFLAPPAAPFLFIAAAGTGVASGAMSLTDRLQQTSVSTSGVAIDVLGIASSILGGAAAFRALRQGSAIALATRSGRFLVWSGFASDAAGATLISVEGVQGIQAVLNDPGLSRSQKVDAIVRVLAGLTLTGGLLVLSAADLRRLQAPKQGTVGGATLPTGDVTPTYRLSPEAGAEEVQALFIRHIDEEINDDQLRGGVLSVLEGAGVPQRFRDLLQEADEYALASVVRADAAALAKLARSSDPELLEHLERLIQGRLGYKIQDKDYRWALRNAERLRGLPLVKDVTPIKSGTGGLGLIFAGEVDGKMAIIKADSAIDYGTEEAVRVLAGLEAYGGPRSLGVMRVLDPETGLWREAVAMERIEGKDLLSLTWARKRGDALPFPVTQRHLEAIDALERTLNQQGKHLSETNLGDFMLTPDPKRPLVPLDMFVDDGVAPHAGMLDTQGKPIRDTIVSLIEPVAGRLDDVERLSAALGQPDVYLHYTDEAGLRGILAGETPKLLTDGKNRVYVTQELYNQGEAHQNLFIGNPSYAGKGSHLIAFKLPQGLPVAPGTQQNERVISMSFKIPKESLVYAGPNPFD